MTLLTDTIGIAPVYQEIRAAAAGYKHLDTEIVSRKRLYDAYQSFKKESQRPVDQCGILKMLPVVKQNIKSRLRTRKLRLKPRDAQAAAATAETYE